MANILLEQAFRALDEIQDEIEVSAKDLYESKEEEINLPKEVTFTASEVGLDTDSQAEDDEYVSELLGDMLSDKYGFCHYGFNYKVEYNEDGEPSEFKCYDIKWDTTESLDKYITAEDDDTDLDTYEDRLHHLKDLYDMEPGDLTADEIKELHDAGMLEEKVESIDVNLPSEPVKEKHVCEKCGKEVCECDKKLQEGPNTTTTISVLDDGEKVIKQGGYTGLTKKVVNGKPVYTVKYAPGYVVSNIEAKNDKEAIRIFNVEHLGLSESYTDGLNYYVATAGNPKHAVVFNKEEDAVAYAKSQNAKEDKEGEWKVSHFSMKDNELVSEPVEESLQEEKENLAIKYWVDEEHRDQGISDLYFGDIKDLEDAKNIADKLFDEYASVEVVKNVDTDHEEVLYGRYPEDESLKESIKLNKEKDLNYTNSEESLEKYISDYLSRKHGCACEFKYIDNGDNVNVYDIKELCDESLKEELTKEEKEVSEEHKEDDKVVCAKCGSEEVKFNDIKTKEPLCADCYEKSCKEHEKDEQDSFIKESITVNINDEDAVKKAKEEVKNSEKEDDEYEQIVDVDADSIEELKDSYIGNVVLVCPDCKTPRFIKPDLLVKDEETGLFNVGEPCTHCGSEKGYTAEGQIASSSIEVDKEDTATTGASEVETKVEVDEKEEEKKSEEEKPLPSAIESKQELSRLEKVDLNEQRFDRLVNKFVHTTYENVESYKTNNLYLDDDNTLIVEGVIKYTSGKEKEAQFKLTEKKLNTQKEDAVALTGICEAFNTSEKAFTFRGTLSENVMNLNSLTFNFNTKVLNEDKNIKGKVLIRD